MSTISDRWRVKNKPQVHIIVPPDSPDAYIAKNKIKNLIGHESDILQMTSLNTLSITRATTPCIHEICQLTTLCELTLAYVHIAEIPPAISQLVHLQKLKLKDNDLTSLSPEICQLRSLAWLIVQHNKLRELPPTLTLLSNLTYLSLNDNQLEEVPDFVDLLPELHILHICENNITIAPAWLAELNVEQIQLTQNPFTHIHMRCRTPWIILGDEYDAALKEHADAYGWVIDAAQDDDLREETWACLEDLSYARV